jgi:L-asparagine transporter-like permease
MKTLTWVGIFMTSILLLFHLFFALLLGSHNVPSDTTSTVSGVIFFLVLILAVLIRIKKKQNAQSDED